MKCGKCSRSLTANQIRDGIRFCSRACSNSAVPRLASEESRQKMKASLSASTRKLPRNELGQIQRTCTVCSNIFSVDDKQRRKKICSDVCRTIHNFANAKLAAATRKERGIKSVWKVRTVKPSYAEQYFITLFEKRKFPKWQREVPFGKWFADFAFPTLKLVVEVDGKQHREAARHQNDLEKDKFIAQLGWTVFRIEWSNPTSLRGKERLYPQLDKLIEFIEFIESSVQR